MSNSESKCQLTRKWSANNGPRSPAEHLFQIPGRCDLHDSEATDRLVCYSCHRLDSVHACGLKVSVELDSSRFSMLPLAVPEVSCQCTQMSLKNFGGSCNQSQLASGASPLFWGVFVAFLATSSDVSGVQAVCISLCFDENARRRVKIDEPSPGQRFSLIYRVTQWGHGIMDHQSLPANHIVKFIKKTCKSIFFQSFGVNGALVQVIDQ